MKKLTIEEKIKGYQFALNRIKSYNGEFYSSRCICDNLFDYIVINDIEDSDIITSAIRMPTTYFKELLKYKPEETSIFYWPIEDSKTRIKVLKEIIAELKQQVK